VVPRPVYRAVKALAQVAQIALVPLRAAWLVVLGARATLLALLLVRAARFAERRVGAH
jgi:hypothetical protein